jgi:hypothetical protein
VSIFFLGEIVLDAFISQSLKGDWCIHKIRISHCIDNNNSTIQVITMAFLKDTEREQLRQLVKACLLEISKLKIELKKCQKESSRSLVLEHSKLQDLQKDQDKTIQKKEDEIQELVKQLEDKDLKIKELQQIKNQFKLLTQKPKKDLTSFQSNIYLLLPDKEDNLENLFDWIIDMGFTELTLQNFEHALRNLERKGYFRSRNNNGTVMWKKIDKD